VTLTNTGSVTLTISSIAIGGANYLSFSQSKTCGSTLTAGASCTVSVKFGPGAEGIKNATLVVTGNAANSPQSTALTGTGMGPLASLSPASVAFGNQTVSTTSAAKTVTLTNTGNGAMTISGIALAGTNPRQFAETTNCGSTLTAGASCTISATFAPTWAAALTAILTVTDNAPGSPHKISLTGTGVGTPAASLSGTSLGFGTQAVGSASSAETVTLTNTGTAALRITGIAINGANLGVFTESNTCGTAVSVGAHCTISVRMHAPSAGSKSASLTVTDNAPNSPQSVALSGSAQ
jgi:hypothetical protein